MPRISISLVNDRHKLLSELAEPEIYAIGYVTVNWAILEHFLLAKTMDLAGKAKIPLPEDAIALSFKKRIRTWRTLIRKTVKYKPTQTKLLNLATKISSIQRSRHRVTHGLWDWIPERPEKLKALSLRLPYEFEEPFDLDKLIKLGDRIAEINFQLCYPRGKSQAWQDMAEAASEGGGVVSRDFLLRITGKAPVNPHLLQPIPPEGK